LDATVFKTSDAEYWWSSDSHATDPTRVWVTNAGGGIGPHPKSETVSAGGNKRYHARCVRSGIKVEKLISAFTDNGDGTATDLRTGLVWQQQPSDPLTWEEALAYAERLALAGHDDWRMPHIKELRSLNDDQVVNPSLNRSGFPGSAPMETWSSTTLFNQPERAWTVDFAFGIASYRRQDREIAGSLCARGLSQSDHGLCRQFRGCPGGAGLDRRRLHGGLRAGGHVGIAHRRWWDLPARGHCSRPRAAR